MERIRALRRRMGNRANMDGGGDERWGNSLVGIVGLRQPLFPGNRSSVHVIRRGGVGGLGSIFSFNVLLICLTDVCWGGGG